MTDELKHPADGPEQEISSEPAGFAADASEKTKEAADDQSAVPESIENSVEADSSTERMGEFSGKLRVSGK